MRALSLTRLHPRVMLEPQMPADAPRAQLIHIETDRRLGHEWDEWDGKPLAGNGDFSAPPGLFFQFGALTLVVGLGAAALLLFLLAPRLEALLPRCLSKQALAGVLAIAGRYEVPVFVATRGQLARRVIRERRPRAVVAVACERDMTTGLRDVAGKLPVLGLTMRLPNGPCRDAVVDLDVMERWVRSWVSQTAS